MYFQISWLEDQSIRFLRFIEIIHNKRLTHYAKKTSGASILHKTVYKEILQLKFDVLYKKYNLAHYNIFPM